MSGSPSFSERVEQFMRSPELQKVFEEARGLAKDAGSKTRIDDARKRLEHLVHKDNSAAPS